jgi:hypothetical protein
MNVIRVKTVGEFNGEDIVLLAADSAGLDTFLAALTETQQHGSSRFEQRRRVHEFVIEGGAVDIELDHDRVVWRLDDTKAGEIIARRGRNHCKAKVLSSSGRSCQHYSMTCSVRPTLLLSLDEYLSPSWLARRTAYRGRGRPP